MQFNKFMESFAREIGGQFDEYNKNKSIIIVPLKDGRYQAVIGSMEYNSKYSSTVIEVSSKVCNFSQEIDLRVLLEENTKFCHAKFSIVNDFLRVEASAFLDNVTPDFLKEMITEVANTADEWEFRLTGLDVH